MNTQKVGSRRLVGVLLLVVLAAGCGSGDTDPGSSLAESQSSSGFEGSEAHDELRVGSVVYVCHSNEQLMRYTATDGSQEELATPGAYPQKLIAPGSAGAEGELWVVSGDGSGGVSLRSYRDSNSDGVVEPSTVTVLCTADRPDVTRSATFDDATGTLYLLECGTGNVYRARDTNGDRRPDTIDGTPFVHGGWIPGLADLSYQSVVDPSTGAVTQVPNGVTSVARSLRGPGAASVVIDSVGTAADTDADGVADELEDYNVSRVVAPATLTGKLVAGERRVEVTGSWDSTVELREVDAQGGVVQVVASVDLSGASGVLVLSAPLEESDEYVLHDVTRALTSPTYTVLPAEVVIYAPAGPISFTEGQAATIAVEGANFGLLEDVRLVSREVGGPGSISIDYTVASDGRSVQIECPALAGSWVGLAYFWFVEDDQKLYPTLVCDVCAAEEAPEE